jgi:hypothetical protein
MSDDNVRPIHPRVRSELGTLPEYQPPPPPSPEEWAAEQRRIDQQARNRLARDLMVARTFLTVAEAFALADQFADEALRRDPHPPYEDLGPLIGVRPGGSY